MRRGHFFANALTKLRANNSTFVFIKATNFVLW